MTTGSVWATVICLRRFPCLDPTREARKLAGSTPFAPTASTSPSGAIQPLMAPHGSAHQRTAPGESDTRQTYRGVRQTHESRSVDELLSRDCAAQRALALLCMNSGETGLLLFAQCESRVRSNEPLVSHPTRACPQPSRAACVSAQRRSMGAGSVALSPSRILSPGPGSPAGRRPAGSRSRRLDPRRHPQCLGPRRLQTA